MKTKSKTSARSRLNPVERRQQLLECAVRLFAEKGIGEAKHADIAEAAGVSVATTFVYFETREALVDAVLDEVANYQLSVFEAPETDDLALFELLHALANRILDLADAKPDYMKVWLGWSTNFEAEKRARFLAIEDEIVTRVALAIRRSMDIGENESRDNARILTSASQNLSTMKLDGVDVKRMQRFIDHTIAVVLAFRDK
jgi:TetR/AcrR family hemagglutinin/protease transcriptional regulator